jgi:hypothetical protein
MVAFAPGDLAMPTPHQDRNRKRSSSSQPTPESPQTHWLSLTDLGRIYGISAVHCGRLLSDAGLRQGNGAPSARALKQGLAYQHHPQSPSPSAVWNEEGCAPLLQDQGLRPMAENNLISQWADLLAALVQGSPSISTSAEEMASDLPQNLVTQVNLELQQRGCSFQVGARSPNQPAQPRRRASACRRARSSSSRS